jgi:hypothetical protein
MCPEDRKETSMVSKDKEGYIRRLERPLKEEDEDLDLGAELRKAVDIAHHAGSRVVIGGQSFLRSRQLLALLLDAGIDALSVDPEWIPETKRLIADIEMGEN